MSKWEEVVEDGNTFYVNDEIGAIFKAKDGRYVLMIPKQLRLGPFDDLADAKTIAENAENSVNEMEDALNTKMLDMLKMFKG